MKKTIVVLSILVMVMAVYSCKKHTDTLTTTAYLDLPTVPYKYQQFSGDPRVDYQGTLGRVLFYDAHMSVNNTVSCASCHQQALGRWSP